MSRGLGSLTLDLIVEFGGFIEGWDKSERETKKRAKQLRKEVKEIGDEFEKWGKRVVLATTAATTALIVHTVRASRELSGLAQVSSATVEEFQRYAAGARHAGVENEKLSDIFLNTNKAIGEFLRAGAGPMKDFFEQVAPKIGVTADEFRDLSGPQALQLYFNSLQKANLSQSEMSFYLEKMAAGSSKLIPLLRDGGEGFKLFADEAERAGAILDSKTIDSADKLSAAFLIFENSAKGFKNELASGLMPTLVDLSSVLSGVSSDTMIASSSADILSGSLKFLTASAVGTLAAIDITRKSIAGLLAMLRSKSAVEPVMDDLKETVAEYGNILNSIWDAGENKQGNLDKRLGEVAEMFKKLRESTISEGGGIDVNSKLQEEIDKRLEMLQQASMSELELLQQKRNQEFQFLIETFDQKTAIFEEQRKAGLQLTAEDLAAEQYLKDEYRRLDLSSEERFQKAKTAIQKQEEMARRQNLSSALGTISTLMNSENRKLFEAGKIAAIANATIAMFEGIGQALRLPWPLNMIIAPLVGAAGIANIQQIRNTKFGGGGAGSAGVSPTQAVNATTTPAIPAASSPTRTFIVQGVDPSQLFSGRQLMEILNETAKDGTKFVFQS